jgi:hypothetical protein
MPCMSVKRDDKEVTNIKQEPLTLQDEIQTKEEDSGKSKGAALRGCDDL